MKRFFITFLSAAAVCAVVSATPAIAQVAGNPADDHTRTLYMKEDGRTPDQGTVGAPVLGPLDAAQASSRCHNTQDFNGRYTVVCGP
jgi:hypothetical protein